MKKISIIAAMAVVCTSAVAQETYENAKIAVGDLNGTATYVGMGGAMEALGGDISTISTNPAGIGLFRKSKASITLGAVSQQDANAFGGGHTTNMSFDQIGFVVASESGSNGYLNFGFNYHKSRNFNFILSAADQLNHASLNKLTYAKQKNGLLYPASSKGVPYFDEPYIQCNQLDYLNAKYVNYSKADNTWYYDEASNYNMDRRHWGYIADYDFNISGNINDRVYLGMTVGYHDVHYKHYSEYTEHYPQFNSNAVVLDDRQINGGGADIKAGIIFRPMEFSPFRIGLSVATPTWYGLTTDNYTYMTGSEEDAHERYEFKVYTPWKFGLSLGHTVGDYLALGASYEYADYGSIDTRIITGEEYSWWYDEYYNESESDNVMNRHTAETLKGVSTLKLGAELRPSPELAIRFGYNYVSPVYKKDGFKDGTLDSPASLYSSATDYTNWEATNRITCGIGLKIDNLNLSAAYQYSTQNGYFSPFMSYMDNVDAADDNIPDMVKVQNKRHHVMLTATYTF